MLPWEKSSRDLIPTSAVYVVEAAQQQGKRGEEESGRSRPFAFLAAHVQLAALQSSADLEAVSVPLMCLQFARLYPLSQNDLPLERKPVDFGPLMPATVKIENPSRDYTPPKFISLLFTDLGVLTPAAVSDELIQLYV